MFANFFVKRLFSTVNIKFISEKKAVEVILANPKKRNPLSV